MCYNYKWDNSVVFFLSYFPLLAWYTRPGRIHPRLLLAHQQTTIRTTATTAFRPTIVVVTPDDFFCVPLPWRLVITVETENSTWICSISTFTRWVMLVHGCCFFLFDCDFRVFYLCHFRAAACRSIIFCWSIIPNKSLCVCFIVTSDLRFPKKTNWTAFNAINACF